MRRRSAYFRGIARLALTLVVVWAGAYQVVGLAERQTNQGPTPSQKVSAAQAPTTPAEPPPQGQGKQAPAQTPPAKPPGQEAEGAHPRQQKEVKITPQEAKQLFESVDQILAFDSKQTGLPIKKEVKKRLTSRDEVVAYLTGHMKDEDVQRLRRSELVLKKFGLLPRDFDLEKLLVDLLREQVAGYYDPKTKTVNLLDWVPLEEQEPVMAHELTHALQDQTINLQKWMKKGEKDLGEIKKPPTPADIENDEIDNARQAVLEGQAEAMMLQYSLVPVGRSIVDAPDLVAAMEESMVSGTPDSTVFAKAPVFLRESLTFPYSYGLDFVVKLWEKNGKEKAFAAVLHNPPHTTRQIMQPDTYLAGETIPPMPVVDFARDFRNYQKFDIGAMGEFDVDVLIEQYAGRKAADRMYPEWRGGYYYAAHAKADPKGPLALFYVSRWSSAEKAEEFAEIYARSLKDRYKKLEENEQMRASIPRYAAVSEQEAAPKHDLLTGRHEWTTEEGALVIEQRSDQVFITESFDSATTETLEREVFGK
jgi:hypothetical protein